MSDIRADPPGSSPATVPAAFAAAVAVDPARPLLTFYDDAVGERTELSGATLANWVAKTANLLVDGLGLGTGDVARVALPPHWQTAAVLLGCWSAGLAVALDPTGVSSAGADRASVAFVGPSDPSTVRAGEVYALALAPMAAPFRPGPPPGTLDYVVEVRGHADHFGGPWPSPDSAALADGTSHAALLARARAVAPVPGSRLLIGDSAADPVSWLLAPLVAPASIVLCANLDPARLPARLATERATLPSPPPLSSRS